MPNPISKERRQENYRKNRERFLAYQREYSKQNREKLAATRKEKHKNISEEKRIEIRDKRRIRDLMQKYGLTVEDYDQMLSDQEGACALCDRLPEKERYGRLSVDHCHDTGKVRGLLCNSCNYAIGVLGDTADHVGRAVTYLEKSRNDKHLIYSASDLRIIYEE